MKPKDIEIRSVHYKTLDNGACGVEVEWTTPDLFPEGKYNLYSLSFDLYQRYCSDETIFDWCRKCIYENYYRKNEETNMTPKEAWDFVNLNFLSDEKKKEILKTLGDLVAKATPMKPTNLIIAIGYCPICENIVANKMNYCHHCGQALDWSEK